MSWDPNLWTVPLLLAGVLTGILTWISWQYRKYPGLIALTVFLGVVTIWILGYLGEIAALETSTMVWMAKVEYLGIAFVGPTWLAFALAYTGRSKTITPVRLAGALSFSTITVLAAWTSSWHGLLWRSVDVVETSAGTVLAPSYGPWFWVNIGFQYGCLALATFLLLWKLARESSPHRGQGAALILGTLAPWMGNLLYVSGWEAAAGIDLTVYGLAAGGVVFGWGVLGRDFIEIVPVARERIVEISGDALLVIDREGRVVDANPTAQKLLEGPTPLLRSFARDALAHLGFDPQTLEVGRSLLEFMVGDPPRTRIFDCRVSELGEATLASQGRVVALRDVTEAEMHRRALEEGREALESQLRQSQKMEMVGTLAGGIAHDFNNILAAIRGYAELASVDLPQDSPSREDIEQVIRGADRARNLVRQILTFSRRAPENRRRIRLQEVLHEAVGFIRASLPTTIELRMSVQDDAPEVHADSTQMYQIVLNLCSNAADAMVGMTAGVMNIELAVALPDPGRLPEHLEAVPGGSWLRLSIRDAGRGMDEETRRKIFDPFFTTKDVGKGTGLGMAVVHGIVASHDGWVDVASRPGLGTEVTIWIPVSGNEGKKGDSAHEEAPLSPGGALKVLVVDDEDSIIKLTRRFLESMGHQVRSEDTVAKAREVFKQDPGWPDLILTDHTMPGGTGLDLANSIRGAGSRVPIILMTGFGESLRPESMAAQGIDKLLPKPFSRSDLAAALDSVWDGS